MKIKCAVVDDEFLARQYLTDYIKKVPFLELVGDYNSPLKVMDHITAGEIDLMFLDIRMPDILGTEFLRSISNPPMVIFTTAYSDYALEGYDLHVIDYLLKPFPIDRFLTAVNKAKEQFELKQSSSKKNAEELPPEFHPNYLVVRADRKYYKINYENLFLVEGQKAYVTFHTDQKKITALVSMKDLTEQLPPDQYVRIHKSYIASIKHMEELEGAQVKIKGEWYPIGKSHREEVEKVFGI
jgi:DNA-binding LytR/AlgR family response regulator